MLLIPEDEEAQAFLKMNEKNRLDIVRKRAQSWLAGIAALSGLLTTVLVVSGPDSVTGLKDTVKYWVASLLLLSLIVLSTANILAYTAAYGSIGSLASIPADNAVGLHHKLTIARKKNADQVQWVGFFAIACTLFGVVLLAVAIGLTWFFDQEMTDMCVYQNETSTKIEIGSKTNFTGFVTIGPCM
jgi:hypothetical protein